MSEEIKPGINKKQGVLISIVMPSLNVASFIRPCIESVLLQSLQEIEILCIDAGSTDGTAEILKEYAAKDPRVRIIETEKKSYGYQVNLGISKAQGEYIGIVETDDYIDKNMYQTLYSYAVFGHPDYIKGGYIPFCGEGDKIYCGPIDRSYLNKISGKLIDLNIHREKGLVDLNHIWSGIYRRDFLREKDIKLHESQGASYQDVSFSLLVGLLADTAVYIQDSCYHYRLDNAGSSVKSSAKWRCIIEEFQYLETELVKRQKYSPMVQAAVIKEKIGSYHWNAMRLPEKERKWFIEEIQQELQHDACQELYDGMDSATKALLNLLRHYNMLENHFVEKNQLTVKTKQLITKILNGDQFVLISAGKLGKKILQLQDVLGKKFIKAIADNDTERQGTKWEQYMLLSVLEATQKYKNCNFIIANKKNSNQLFNQLIVLGICENKIYQYSSLLPIDEMILLAAQIEEIDVNE